MLSDEWKMKVSFNSAFSIHNSSFFDYAATCYKAHAVRELESEAGYMLITPGHAKNVLRHIIQHHVV